MTTSAIYGSCNPVTILSLWSLCFAAMIPPKEAGERGLLEQAAKS